MRAESERLTVADLVMITTATPAKFDCLLA
jgi:hypothetical protein